MLDRFKVPDDVAVRVDQAVMRANVEDIFTTLGMSDADARQAADVLIYADIRGIDSHGVSNMMRAYVAGFQAGHINPTPSWRIERDNQASLTVDSDRGLGLVVGPPTMDLAIERAKEFGIGVAVAYNGGHYGAAAYHAHRALDHDMVGVSMTTGGVQVAPTGGAQALLGLNPIGIAAPSGTLPPFIFDASMSSVAGNKIRLLRRMGGKALPGWVAEADGTPIMEEASIPEDFLLLPLGGTREIGSHKGFGLAMLVEVLTSLIVGFGGGPLRRAGSAHYFMAYNVSAFTELETFKADMDAYLQACLDCTPAPDADRVVYPGIPEHEAETDRRENGIPYHPEVLEWFSQTNRELGVQDRFS